MVNPPIIEFILKQKDWLLKTQIKGTISLCLSKNGQAQSHSQMERK